MVLYLEGEGSSQTLLPSWFLISICCCELARHGAQGNGLAQTLLRTVEEALQQAGVHAATMPAIIAAADEAKLPPPPTAPASSHLPPELARDTAGSPAMGLVAPASDFGAGGLPAGEPPLLGRLPADGSLLASHHAAWGCKVCVKTPAHPLAPGAAQDARLCAGLPNRHRTCTCLLDNCSSDRSCDYISDRSCQYQ